MTCEMLFPSLDISELSLLSWIAREKNNSKIIKEDSILITNKIRRYIYCIKLYVNVVQTLLNHWSQAFFTACFDSNTWKNEIVSIGFVSWDRTWYRLCKI